MADQTQTPISPSAQAFMDQARAQAGGGHPPPTATPAPPSGGSGSSSGSSGSSGGGSSPPGSNPPAKSGDGWARFVPLILALAGVISGLATMYYFTWQTSQAGQESKKIDRALEIEKEKTAQIKENARLVREQRRLAEVSQKKTPVPSSVPSTMACLNPEKNMFAHWKPLVIGKNQCLTREQLQEHFWVLFTAVPKEVQGEVWFTEFVTETDSEGKALPKRVSRCISTEASDTCKSYLQGKLNTALSVIHRGNLRITM